MPVENERKDGIPTKLWRLALTGLVTTCLFLGGEIWQTQKDQQRKNDEHNDKVDTKINEIQRELTEIRSELKWRFEPKREAP